MLAIAEVTRPADQGSTQFLVTVDRAEKRRWKLAADDAGLSMAEYVRRAVQQAGEAPTAAEIAEARALAAQIEASVDRMERQLDQTIQRIEAATDPAVEQARRQAIIADIQARGLYLDLDRLAGAHG